MQTEISVKKLFLILFIIITGCKSSELTKSDLNEAIYIPLSNFEGQIDQEDLNFIKNNYFWTDSSILVINFRLPRKDCHFNNHVINRGTKKWWSDFYSRINMEDCTSIYVYSDAKRVKKHLDNKTYFEDTKGVLLKYFDRAESCYGVMVLNETGEYRQFNGHYSEGQVAGFIEELK